MWVAQVPRMNDDEYFVYRVQMLAVEYGVEVEINAKKRTVDVLTDEETAMDFLMELNEEFGND